MKDDWKVIVWRFVRGTIAAGVAQVLVSVNVTDLQSLQALVNDPSKVQHIVVGSFVVGIILSLSKWARNQYSDTTVVKKLPV